MHSLPRKENPGTQQALPDLQLLGCGDSVYSCNHSALAAEGFTEPGLRRNTSKSTSALCVPHFYKRGTKCTLFPSPIMMKQRSTSSNTRCVWNGHNASTQALEGPVNRLTLTMQASCQVVASLMSMQPLGKRLANSHFIQITFLAAKNKKSCEKKNVGRFSLVIRVSDRRKLVPSFICNSLQSILLPASKSEQLLSTSTSTITLLI